MTSDESATGWGASSEELEAIWEEARRQVVQTQSGFDLAGWHIKCRESRRDVDLEFFGHGLG